MKTNRRFADHQAAFRQESAFTLTDLLAVIVTLAILALLGWSALARSDDNGTRMVCMSNLRQMGMAMNMYAGDNRGYLAYPNYDGGHSASAPQGWLYSMNPNQGLPTNYPSGAIPNPYSTVSPYVLLRYSLGAWQSGLWFQYVQNFKYYLCPVDIESAYYKPPAPAGRSNKLSSYVMNGSVIGFLENPGSALPCKITDIWSPACYLLWEPDENASGAGFPGALAFNDGSNYPDVQEGPGRLHSANGGNLLCVGGNVEFVTVQTWALQAAMGQGSGPGGKTLGWWAPTASNGD
jgi:type II secretory pathway pseudopilin PulG